MRFLEWCGIVGSSVASADAGDVARPRISTQNVAELRQHFPIGARVQYYPEFQKNIKLDSVLLAYNIDGDLIYSNHGIRVAETGPSAGITLIWAGGRKSISGVDRFHLVVPHRDRLELDYPVGQTSSPHEKLTEKAVNDFKRGNTVTLFNNRANGKVPHVDTTVARVVLLKEGYYANRKVALLEPDFATLIYQEQRFYHRVYTRIPATLSESQDAEPHECWIQDFSERFVRVEICKTEEFVASLREGHRVLLAIELEHESRAFLVRGNVHRKGKGHLVLALSAIFKGGRFQNLDLIDELDLKTTLLHHPETQRTVEAPE